MRKARKALADLFDGANGIFKHPSRHRSVSYGDAILAAEAVLLADLLLGLLERATVATYPPP